MLDEPSDQVAWFEFSSSEGLLGRVYFELFDKLCPLTCENFKGLCTGEYGQNTTTGTPLHYKGTTVFRIIPNFIIQGGDISRQEDGTGGESIFVNKGGSRYFKDESFLISHSACGLLSMVNEGPDTNQSQFFITCAPCPWLDGRNVVFGRVIRGYDVLARIEACGSPSGAVQDANIRISDCGVAPREDVISGGIEAVELKNVDPLTGLDADGILARGAIKLNFDRLREPPISQSTPVNSKQKKSAKKTSDETPAGNPQSPPAVGDKPLTGARVESSDGG